jgi:hypothetical protein
MVGVWLIDTMRNYVQQAVGSTLKMMACVSLSPSNVPRTTTALLPPAACPLQLAVLLLLPEAKRVALEDVHLKFKQHWLWWRFMQRQQQRSQARQPHNRHDQQHSRSASAGLEHVHRPRPPQGALQGLGQHDAGAAAAAAVPPPQQQQQPNVSPAGVVLGNSSVAGSVDASQQEGSSSSVLGAFSVHAQQLHPLTAHAAGNSRAASGGLSMQPAGTMSFDLEELMYGRR